jgi:hypothetical protein
MAIFVFSFVILVLAMLGMAIGVLCGRPPIRGSCGGLSDSAGSKGKCLVCYGGCDKKSSG